MPFYILALGNPGEKYENTRHSVGRMFAQKFVQKYGFSDWKIYKNKMTETSKGDIEGVSVNLIKLDEFMNTSGRSGGPAIKAGIPKKAIVIHDDLDLPFGSFKVSYGRGAGGHKGVESLIKNLKTKNFWRVRIGISPKTVGGKIRKISDREKVKDHVLKTFSKKEKEELEKEVFPEIFTRIEDIVSGKTKLPEK